MKNTAPLLIETVLLIILDGTEINAQMEATTK